MWKRLIEEYPNLIKAEDHGKTGNRQREKPNPLRTIGCGLRRRFGVVEHRENAFEWANDKVNRAADNQH